MIGAVHQIVASLAWVSLFLYGIKSSIEDTSRDGWYIGLAILVSTMLIVAELRKKST